MTMRQGRAVRGRCNVSAPRMRLERVTFEEYAAARLPALLRYALMLTGDPHMAEDVVQDTMVRAYGRWRRVQRADHPDRYVKRMLTNAYLSSRRGPWGRAVPYAEAPEVPVLDASESSALRHAMWGRLAELPPRQRAAVVLRFYEDLPDADIAEVLGCAVGTVRSQISRALDTLRRAMKTLDGVGHDR